MEQIAQNDPKPLPTEEPIDTKKEPEKLSTYEPKKRSNFIPSKTALEAIEVDGSSKPPMSYNPKYDPRPLDKNGSMLAKREVWEDKQLTEIKESKSVGKPLAVKKSEPI